MNNLEQNLEKILDQNLGYINPYRYLLKVLKEIFKNYIDDNTSFNIAGDTQEQMKDVNIELFVENIKPFEFLSNRRQENENYSIISCYSSVGLTLLIKSLDAEKVYNLSYLMGELNVDTDFKNNISDKLNTNINIQSISYKHLQTQPKEYVSCLDIKLETEINTIRYQKNGIIKSIVLDALFNGDAIKQVMEIK